jgi:hypothetical protein
MRARFWAASSIIFASMCSTILHAQSVGPALMPPSYQFVDPNGVDLSSATYSYQLKEAEIGSGAGRIALVRYWSSAAWTSNWGSVYVKFQFSQGAIQWAAVSLGGSTKYFLPHAGGILAVRRDGSSLSYLGSGRIRYVDSVGEVIIFSPPSGWTGSPLGMCNNAVFKECIAFADTKSLPDGTIYRFDWSIFNSANTLSARLSRVESNTGYSLDIQYVSNTQGSTNQFDVQNWFSPSLSTLKNKNSPAGASTQVGYAYVGNGQLITTLPSGTQYKYLYNVTTAPKAQLESIENFAIPISNKVEISYENGYLYKVVINSAETWYFSSYFTTLNDSTLTSVSRQDPFGGVTSVALDGQAYGPFPSRVTDPLGAATQFTHDPYGRMTKYVRPNSITENLSYDERGNVLLHSVDALPNSGLASVGRTAIFPASCANAVTCNRPSSVTDARGASTEFTYAPEHGGVLTETGPAPSAGAPRPQTRYQYVQREAWLKASGSGYAPTGQPIWLMSRKASCRTTAALADGTGCTGGTADELVTLYDYGPAAGPNNLNLRGIVEDANGAALRTCYGYDWQGNKISETKPQAGLTACP